MKNSVKQRIKLIAILYKSYGQDILIVTSIIATP